jgi:hypothetical protein
VCILDAFSFLFKQVHVSLEEGKSIYSVDYLTYFQV